MRIVNSEVTSVLCEYIICIPSSNHDAKPFDEMVIVVCGEVLAGQDGPHDAVQTCRRVLEADPETETQVDMTGAHAVTAFVVIPALIIVISVSG